jgi:AcrR family transcriptional regulator
MSVKVHSVNIRPRKRTPGRKAAYHHGNLRAALVAAALASLEQGSRELSLRELARNVGVTVNAAYRHFADKEAVLAAVAAEGFRRFGAAQQAARQDVADPKQAMLALGRAYVDFAQKHPALFRLMFGRFDRAREDEELAQTSRAAFEPLIAGITASVNLPADDPRALAVAVRAWGLVHGLSHLLLDRQLDRLTSTPIEVVAAAIAGLHGDSSASVTPKK